MYVGGVEMYVRGSFDAESAHASVHDALQASDESFKFRCKYDNAGGASESRSSPSSLGRSRVREGKVAEHLRTEGVLSRSPAHEGVGPLLLHIEPAQRAVRPARFSHLRSGLEALYPVTDFGAASR